MTEKRQLGGLDYFKLAASFLVAAIHTSPFASFSAEADFIFTRVIARVAVPFFFMVTGYFLLPQYVFGRSMDMRPLMRSLKKFLYLYAAAVLIYLPVNLYAGQLQDLGVPAFFRMVLFNGTFYHLWYLPAAVLGVWIVWFLGRKLPYKVLLGISFVLYLIGLFGDSYYGAAEQVPVLVKVYDVLFMVSSYTRNGLFYAPVFLVMGAGLSRRKPTGGDEGCHGAAAGKGIGRGKHAGEEECEGRRESTGEKECVERGAYIGKEEHAERREDAGKKELVGRGVCTGRGRIAVNMTGVILSAVLMTAEGLWLRRLNLQRHDSMYIMLPPVMFFLFQILLAVRCKPVKSLRTISTWIYLLHPLCIILVRGGAKAAHMEGLFVDNSLVHYLAVCAVSGAAACVVAWAAGRKRMQSLLAVFTGRSAACTSAFEQGERCSGKERAWIELSRENLARNVEVLQSLLMQERRALSGQYKSERLERIQYATECSEQANRQFWQIWQAISKRMPAGRTELQLRHTRQTFPQLMPAVKADAYGHGAVLIAKALQDMGIGAFCVACAEEGAELRRNGITGDILILGYTHPEAFFLLKKYRLIQTVVDYRYGKFLNGYGKKIRVHVGIDTGMHRLGERSEKIKEIGRIFRLKNLQVEGIFTHLSADETKDPAERAFTKRQGEAFYGVLEKLEKQGVSGLKIHLLASYGLLNYPELGGDYVRVGIALYGLLSDEEAGKSCPVKLYPVLSLKARIAAVKDLYRGESAGYGLDYKAEEDKKIAVLAIGYADGLPRCLSEGRGRVLIRGQSAPVIGRICMDQTIVDVTGIPGVRAGESAVVIGRSGGEEITAYEIAKEAGTITNEVLSRLGKRLSIGWEKDSTFC